MSGQQDCVAGMQGRHDAELKWLKEGQIRMETSVKELTIAIKEYVVITQETQSKRIDEMEHKQEKQEKMMEKMDDTVEKLGISLVSTKGKTDFTYKVIIATSGVLIIGMVGVIFNLIWSNATHIKEIEKADKVVSLCLSYFGS